MAAISWCPRPCVRSHRAYMTAWVYSFFRIKASDEEACSVITGNSTATLCEIRVTRATGKLNMSPRRVNIPLLYKCNLVWCDCHDALPVKEEIIHTDWMGRGPRRASPLCYSVKQSVRKWERHFVPVWAFPFDINNTVTKPQWMIIPCGWLGLRINFHCCSLCAAWIYLTSSGRVEICTLSWKNKPTQWTLIVKTIWYLLIFFNVGLSVDPPLWLRLKYLNSHWTHCYEIWYRHPWCPEDE